MATELLIFDCDGVLIDSEPVAIGSLAAALQDTGVDASLADIRRRFLGLPEEEIRRTCIEEFELLDADRILSRWRSALYGEFARSLEPMPGMPALVRALGVPKCVASNSTLDRLRHSLGLFDLWGEFEPHRRSSPRGCRSTASASGRSMTRPRSATGSPAISAL
jgi:beta-phosphoglucomutase-like phosphatase (HAD superfamily)